MTPTELKQARHKLGLTGVELGALLGVKGRHFRAMEAKPSLSTHKRISKAQAGYVNGLLYGYRPDDWPE